MSNVFSIKEIEEKERMREALKNMACVFISEQEYNFKKVEQYKYIGMKVVDNNFKPKITGLSA